MAIYRSNQRGIRTVATAARREILSSSSRRGARSLVGWGQGASTMALISYFLSASLWVDMRRWRGRQPWSLEIVGFEVP
jgi:hypothetical protein